MWIIFESHAAENGKCFYHLNVLLTLFLPPGAFDPISITKVFILSIFVFLWLESLFLGLQYIFLCIAVHTALKSPNKFVIRTTIRQTMLLVLNIS